MPDYDEYSYDLKIFLIINFSKHFLLLIIIYIMPYQLEDIKGIGKGTADKLRTSGINSIEQIANLTVKELVKLNIKSIGETTAQKIISIAKDLLKKESPKEKVIEKSKPKEKISPKASIKSKVSQSLKDLIGKTQAETNIGLVGHVDHGIK